MIAVDTSTFIDWLRKIDSPQTAAMDLAMDDNALFLPPPVEAELLSFPGDQPGLADVIEDLPRLVLTDGFWSRLGATRRTLLRHRLKARMADAMIAQLCLDHGATLIASDTDFRHFADHCGLKLAV